MILEKWMICNLEKFGNCLISSKFYNKHKDKLIEDVKSLGYQDVHVIEKKRAHRPAHRKGRPKLIKTYIIETKIKRKEETHTEVKKMQKFNIGDKVEIIDGTLKGKMGTVEEVEKNDVGDYTYGIKVPSVYSYLGLTAKQTAQLRLEKAAGKKRGRPAKAKETSKVEQLKEVTKEVVELTENQPESTIEVDEVVETVDKTVEVVDEPIETVDKTVDKVVEESKRAYDQLLEAYDVMRRSLNVNELELFSDIVMKDVEASKYVLEKMYQMRIDQLIQIRKGIA